MKDPGVLLKDPGVHLRDPRCGGCCAAAAVVVVDYGQFGTHPPGIEAAPHTGWADWIKKTVTRSS